MGALSSTLVVALAASPGWAQAAAAAPRVEPGAGGDLRLVDPPREVATGVTVELAGAGAPAGARVATERSAPGGWQLVRIIVADGHGGFNTSFRPPPEPRRLRVRARLLEQPLGAAVTPGITVSAPHTVRIRDVVLAAVGDINLGDGPGQVMAARGLRWPWLSVAPLLRSADISFGNLECAVSRRGHPVAKQYRFRGSPGALSVMRSFAGFDVLNLANNHTGDYGSIAAADTRRHVERLGMVGVGAGRDLAAAARPRVVERLGLRIAFVGFSEILPAEFFAGPRRPGTVFASPEAVRSGVRAAARQADVVVATFHWGVERAGRENARQRQLAAVALRAGADAVIGAHPHVLQPVVRRGRRLIAYSLGNFVWSSGSGATSRTGVLVVRLSARGVESAKLRRAVIVHARPRLAG